MRRCAMLLFLLALAACGGDDDDSTATPDPTADASSEPSISDGSGGSIPTGCPLDTAQVAAAVGREVPPDGECRWYDGVATVEVTAQGPGEELFEASKNEATQTHDQVEDLDRGNLGYVGTDELRAIAHVVTDDATYTVTLSSFEGFDQAQYREAAVGLIDAILE